MEPLCNTMNKYHDKMRNYEYVRITRLLKNEENSKKGEITKRKESLDPKK